MSEEQAAIPETEAIKDRASAISAISTMIHPEPAPGPTGPETTPFSHQENPGETAAETDQSEAVTDTPAEDQAQEGDTEDGVELPETFRALAEALEVDEAEFAKALKVERKVNGQTELVSLADAIDHHQLYIDYQRKAAEVAEQRRTVAAERQTAMQAWQERLGHLDALIPALQARLDTGYSDEKLEQILIEDGSEAYLQAKRQTEAVQHAVATAVQERQNADAQWQAENHNKLVEFRQEQQQLLSAAIPELRERDGQQKFERKASDYLRSQQGFSQEQVNQWFASGWDHRHIRILDDAMKYREMTREAPKIKQKLAALPKVSKPGVATGPSDRDAENRIAIRDKLRQAARKGSRKQQKAAGLELVRDIIG